MHFNRCIFYIALFLGLKRVVVNMTYKTKFYLTLDVIDLKKAQEFFSAYKMKGKIFRLWEIEFRLLNSNSGEIIFVAKKEMEPIMIYGINAWLGKEIRDELNPEFKKNEASAVEDGIYYSSAVEKYGLLKRVFIPRRGLKPISTRMHIVKHH